MVNKVLFPTMAGFKDDVNCLKSGYVLSVRMIAIVAVPLCLGTSGLSPVFVRAVRGEDWIPAIMPLPIPSLQGVMNALITPAASVFTSIGKTAI